MKGIPRCVLFALSVSALGLKLIWGRPEASLRAFFPAEAARAVERDFLLETGLPGRSWFRHAFYAPGVYTGYTAAVLPGVREAVDRNDWTGAAVQLNLVQAAIERATGALAQALQALGGP